MTSTRLPNKVFNQQNRFLHLYIAALLMAFSPSKALGQIAPLVVLFGLIFYVQLRPNHHLLLYGTLAGIYVGIGLIYQLLVPDFWWPNYLLYFITSSALLLLLYDYSPIITPDFIRKLGNWTLGIIFVQSCYGILQFIYALATRGYSPAIGDIVWGTMAPPVNTAYAGTSPFFVILISTLALFVLATTSHRLTLARVIALSTVALCWTVASLLHSVIYFSIGVVFALIWLGLNGSMFRGLSARTSRKTRSTFAIVTIIVILFGIGTVVHPANYRNITRILRSVEEFGPDANQRKLRVFYYTIFEIPGEVPVQPLIGLGPGQYSSRAALMGSGAYLQRSSIPFLPDHANPLTEEYILPVLTFAATRGGSSMDSPTASWLVTYGETGMIGLLLVIGLFMRAIIRFERYRSEKFPRMSLAMITLCAYLLLMGFQNVYWEYTQAVFPALLVLKFTFDYVKVERRMVKRTLHPAPSVHPVRMLDSFADNPAL